MDEDDRIFVWDACNKKVIISTWQDIPYSYKGSYMYDATEPFLDMRWGFWGDKNTGGWTSLEPKDIPKEFRVHMLLLF